MAAVAKEIGFDGVELTVRPKGHVLPENARRDLPKAVAAIKEHGLTSTNMMVTGFNQVSRRQPASVGNSCLPRESVIIAWVITDIQKKARSQTLWIPSKVSLKN